MAVLTADFEAGTTSSTIATADTGSLTQWQTINTVASGTLIYDTTHVAHGSKAAKIATGATLGNSMMKWTTSLTGGGGAAAGPFWLRTYLYMTTNTVQIVPISFMNGTFNNRVGVRISTTGKLVVLVNGTTIDKTSTSTMPLNQYVRLEMMAIGSATVGAYELRYFSSMDSCVADEIVSNSAINTAGTIDSVAFGVTQQIANAPAFWMDDCAASDCGFFGPTTGNYLAAAGFIHG